MDFTTFINSRDIREYHRKIGYKYSTTEAAWLVYMCSTKTLKEKHEAWKWIIKNMTDEKIFEGDEKDCSEPISLHRVLDEIIEMDENYSNCISVYIFENTGLDMDIMNLFQLIEPMLPHPFKYGDILCHYGYGGKNIPFVYTSPDADDEPTLVYGYTMNNPERDGRLLYAYLPIVSGLRRTYSYSWNYLINLEYYREELTGTDRYLIPVSDWVKEKYNNDIAAFLEDFFVVEERGK